MEIERVEDYAKRMVSPQVQALLYQLHQQFTCRLEWTKRSQHQFGSNQVITAAPLDDEQWLHYLMLNAVGKATLGEYAWYASSNLPMWQRGPVGCVNLEAVASASIDITSGTTAYLSDDGSIPGFLCWAEPCTLQDKGTCYRFQTNAGVLWLRPLGEGRSLVELFQQQEPSFGGRAQVVKVAETHCHKAQLGHYAGSGPWDGFVTRDESGRQWCIEQSELAFEATLRLRVVRKYNDRLKSRPITVLRPPYEAIWQPDGQHGFGLPLKLSVPNL